MKEKYMFTIAQYLILIILLFSCSDRAITKDNDSYSLDNLPENAVKIEDDLYYIPIGRDQDNCLMYRAYSEKNQVFQAIIYRDKDNNFSLSKNKNSCL